MKTVEIGSFKAKTHFSQLLKGVEEGNTYRILRRGKPVADLIALRQEDSVAQGARQAMRRMAQRRKRIRGPVSVEDICAWRDEGRR